jgi:hypothetical protein
MAEKPWDGRFAEKTDQSVEAFTASIAIDRRLYPMISRAVSPTARCWPRSASSPMRRPAASWRGWADQAGDRSGRIRLRRQPRRHPHAHRSAAAATCGQGGAEAAHRPQPQRSGGPGRAPVPARGDPAHHRSVAAGCGGAGGPGQRPPGCGHARLHPHSSGPSRFCWPTTCWPTTRCSPATGPVFRLAGTHRRQCRWGRRPWPAPPIPSTGPGGTEQLGFPGWRQQYGCGADRDFVPSNFWRPPASAWST